MDRTIILIDRIEQRLLALNMSERKASLNATGKPDLIRDIRRGKEPGSARLAKLAEVLETTSDYLNGRSDDPDPRPAPAPGEMRIPSPQGMPRDLPVYGTALGADADVYSDDRRVAVELTDLNMGEAIDYVRRPPGMKGKDDYVLYVVGDSMAPKYEGGSAVLVSPRRQPAPRDYVVAYMRGQNDDAVVAVMVKRLVRRSSSFVELEQFNPPAMFRVDAKEFTAIHRVVPWDEAMGF